MGDRHRGQCHGATREEPSCSPAGGSDTGLGGCYRWRRVGRHVARGEVACISNPRGGCPGLRKDLLLGLLFGGRDWSLGTCLSTRGECIDVLKRHAGYTAPCLAWMTAGDISTAIPSAGAHSYIPYVRGYSPPLTRGVCPSWVHWPRRK